MFSPFLSYPLELKKILCVAGGDESDLLDPLRLSGDPNLCRTRPLHSELSPPRLAALNPCKNTVSISLSLLFSPPLSEDLPGSSPHPSQEHCFYISVSALLSPSV
jgi:hypothetical protein